MSCVINNIYLLTYLYVISCYVHILRLYILITRRFWVTQSRIKPLSNYADSTLWRSTCCCEIFKVKSLGESSKWLSIFIFGDTRVTWLQVANHRLRTRYNTGDGEQRLQLSYVNVSDGQWHTATVERVGQWVTLTLECGSRSHKVTDSRHMEDRSRSTQDHWNVRVTGSLWTTLKVIRSARGH